MKRLFSLHFVPLFTAHWTALTMQPVLSDVYLGSLSLEETAEIQATHCEVMKLTCFNDQLFFCFIGCDHIETTTQTRCGKGKYN